MAQMRPQHANFSSQSRPLSADFAQDPKQSSMLYSMLPSVVQSRLPRLPSLRKSASMYGLATKRKGTQSGSRTPEMGYTNAMVLSGSRDVVSRDGSELEAYSVESMSSEEDLTQSTNRRRQQTMDLSESKSGISWKYANQGTFYFVLSSGWHADEESHRPEPP